MVDDFRISHRIMILIDDYQTIYRIINHIVSRPTTEKKNIHVFPVVQFLKDKKPVLCHPNMGRFYTCNSPLMGKCLLKHSVDFKVASKLAHEVSHAIAFLKHGLGLNTMGRMGILYVLDDTRCGIS